MKKSILISLFSLGLMILIISLSRPKAIKVESLPFKNTFQISGCSETLDADKHECSKKIKTKNERSLSEKFLRRFKRGYRIAYA